MFKPNCHALLNDVNTRLKEIICRQVHYLKCLIFLVSILSCLKINAQTVQIFASPYGKDVSKGTVKQPLKSLSAALALTKKEHGNKVEIVLRGGTYYLDHTITLNQSDEHFISLKITAYKNEKVTVSAGKRLDVEWKRYNKNVYQASIPKGVFFERLFINGEPQILARYPNYDSTARVYHGTAADAISPERIRRWKNPIGAYVHALHQNEWGSFDYRIVGIDNKGNAELEGGWQNNRPAPMHQQYRFVENVFEELDAPGEWYFDRKSRILYYYPKKDINLRKALVEVSHLKQIFVLKGSAERPLRNVQLNNLEFTATERSFMETKEPLLRSDWTIYRGGAILMDGTSGCSIKNCSFSKLGGNAIMLSNYNLLDTVSDCHIYDIGASAICLVGDVKSVRSPVFGDESPPVYSLMDKKPGPLTNNYPQECLNNNNLIHNIGELEKQVAGVEIDIASSITVSHNTIYNVPRAGINIGDGCFGGHVLAFNDVFNTVLETGDHGAFNSWGRDRYWSANRKYMDSLVALHPEIIRLDVQKPIKIYNNRFRCDHGWDIDLDDGSTNYQIYNNVCLSGGLKLREGFDRIVKNNIIINNSFHPHVWFKNSEDVFEHNIVSQHYYPVRITEWGKNVDYNLFPDTTVLHAAQKNGTDMHSVAGIPKFVNSAQGDYTVVDSELTASIGFHNFPMHEFGVQSLSLKKIAQKVSIPKLMVAVDETGKPKNIEFLGGVIKSVYGLGDRSVYGLPDENGVVVVHVGQSSILRESGLMDNDVIRAVNGQVVKDATGLVAIYQEAKNWKTHLILDVFRNQQKIRLTLKLK